MKRKVLGGVLLLVLIVGASLSRGDLFAQYNVPSRSTEQDREEAKVNQRTRELAAQLRGKPDAAKEAELKKLVEEAFAKRHAAQVAEAKALADKLAKLQELLKKREEKKAEIVARRVKELLGESDDLDWDPNPIHYDPHAVPSLRPGFHIDVIEDTRTPNTPPQPPGPNKPGLIPGLPMMAPTTPGGVPLTTLVGQGQRSDVVNLMANPRTSMDNLKIWLLENDVQLAKTGLKEAVAELDHYTKGEAQLPEHLETLRFAVEKQRLEVDLAVRRLEIAKEQKNAKIGPASAP